VDGIRYVHRVALRLPVDVEQNCRFTIGGHDRIDGLDRGQHGGDIADLDGSAARRGLDHDVRDLVRRAGLAADEA